MNIFVIVQYILCASTRGWRGHFVYPEHEVNIHSSIVHYLVPGLLTKFLLHCFSYSMGQKLGRSREWGYTLFTNEESLIHGCLKLGTVRLLCNHVLPEIHFRAEHCWYTIENTCSFYCIKQCYTAFHSYTCRLVSYLNAQDESLASRLAKTSAYPWMVSFIRAVAVKLTPTLFWVPPTNHRNVIIGECILH